jgi:hypothetical protein
MSAIVSTFSSVKQPVSIVADLPAQYLDSERPSQFLDGLRLLSQAIISLPREQSVLAVEPSLQKILAKSITYRPIAPVNCTVTSFFVQVLSHPFPAQHHELSARLASLLQPTDSPSFADSARLVSAMMGAIPSPASLTFSDEILERAHSLPVFLAAMDVFAARLMTNTSNGVKHADSSLRVADLNEVISDVGRISFPPHLLYYGRQCRRYEDFLFEIGSDASAPIDAPAAFDAVVRHQNNRRAAVRNLAEAVQTVCRALDHRPSGRALPPGNRQAPG